MPEHTRLGSHPRPQGGREGDPGCNAISPRRPNWSVSIDLDRRPSAGLHAACPSAGAIHHHRGAGEDTRGGGVANLAHICPYILYIYGSFYFVLMKGN